jgi:hypothetical protein
VLNDPSLIQRSEMRKKPNTMMKSASLIRTAVAGLLFCAALATRPVLAAAAEPSGKARPSRNAADSPRPVVRIVVVG